MSSENDKEYHHKYIKEQHIKATLKADKGEKAELLSWTIVDFTDVGDNYATVVTSVKVIYRLRGKEECKSYIVKVNSDKGLPFLKPITPFLFQKESGFYEYIVPLLNEVLAEARVEPLRFPKWTTVFWKMRES